MLYDLQTTLLKINSFNSHNHIEKDILITIIGYENYTCIHPFFFFLIKEDML